MAKIYNENDVSVRPLEGKTVGIIGYGNQGRAQALNARDSGLSVLIGARPDGLSETNAQADGFETFTPLEVAKRADLLMILTPDEVHGNLYNEVEEALKPGTAIGFSHGFSVHFNLLKPRDDLDVVLIAPKGPGHTLRGLYLQGRGMPCLIGVEKNTTGTARDIALHYAVAIGAGRAGILESSFREECETDLFSEQVVLCGGLPGLVKAAFKTLVDKGYAPEVAYIECLHEVKQIADLMWQGGLDHMAGRISNTAEFGGYKAEDAMIDDALQAKMDALLVDIQSGAFAEALMREAGGGYKNLKARRTGLRALEIEAAGERVRTLMPWLKD